MRPDGYLFPGIPALVSRGEDAELYALDFATGWAGHARGRVADEIHHAVVTGSAGSWLRALDGHPAAGVARWSEADRMPLTASNAVKLGGFDTLFLELLATCNERCVHCYALSGPKQTAALDRETCEAVIDDAAELGFRRVQFTGGDPLLCRFLPQLVARARERGIQSCEIYTNGLLLEDALLDQLAGATPSIAFSFYSHVAETHDRITRTPGSQQRTARAIERAVARGLRVRASIVVMEANADHVADTAAYLRTLGVEHVAVSTTFAVGRGRRFEGAFDAAGMVQSHGGSADQRARGKLCVTYDGTVVPCIFNRADILGRLGRRRLRDIARAPALTIAAGPLDDAFLSRCRNRLECASCRLTACALRLSPGRIDAA